MADSYFFICLRETLKDTSVQEFTKFMTKQVLRYIYRNIAFHTIVWTAIPLTNKDCKL